jgi:hypothetical protein
MKLLITGLMLLISGFATAQDTPQQSPDQNTTAPVQADPVETKINSLLQCFPGEKGVGHWEIYLVGNTDDAKLNFIKALDLIADNTAAASSTYMKQVKVEYTLRKTELYYSFDTFKMLKQMAEKKGEPAFIDKVNNTYAVRSLLSELLKIDDLSIICKRPMAERSMAPNQMRGAVGSN